MIMIEKTPGSHMGSPAAAEGGGEVMGGGRGESGEGSARESEVVVADCFFFKFKTYLACFNALFNTLPLAKVMNLRSLSQ